MKRILMCLILAVSLFSSTASAFSTTGKVRLTYNINYDSVLRLNYGLGLYITDGTTGELDSNWGLHFGVNKSENGFCFDFGLAGMILNPATKYAVVPIGGGAGLAISYLYNDGDGTVYSAPVRGLGISARATMFTVSINVGIYQELEHEERNFIYRVGAGIGF